MAGAAGFGYQTSIKNPYLGDSPTRECCPVEQLKSLSCELQVKQLRNQFATVLAVYCTDANARLKRAAVNEP